MTRDDVLRPLYALLRRFWLPPWLFWRAALSVNTHFLMGVVGVIQNAEGEVLIFSHTYRKAPWGLPGGWLKGGETPLEGLEREIREESGLRVKAERIALVGVTRDRPKIEFVVLARLEGGEFAPSGEVSAMQWRAPDRMPPMPRIQKRILELVDGLAPGESGVYDTIWIGEGLAE